MADNPKREELLRRRSVASKAEESIGGKPRKLDQAAILKATAERRQREQRQPQQNERRPRGDPAPDLDGGFGFSIVDVVLIFLAMVVAVGGMWGIVYMVNSDSAPDAFKSFGRKTGVPPVQFRLEVPLHVVYSGSEVTVDFPNGKQTICSECRGAGGQGVRTCPTCYGKGNFCKPTYTTHNFLFCRPLSIYLFTILLSRDNNGEPSDHAWFCAAV